MTVALRRADPVSFPKCEELGDLRFRKLLASAAWTVLPAEVKTRFSKRLVGGATAVYAGRVTDVRISKLGHMLAQVLRMIGAPLPLFRDVGVPTVVTVTEDVKTGGQIWSRMYCNRSGFPQVIHSAKQFSGPTGLEEFIGCGISMALTVAASAEGLTFTSAGYFLRLAGWRLPLPKVLSPGQVTVRHTALAGEEFEFSLLVQHPLFGELICQSAVYHDQ